MGNIMEAGETLLRILFVGMAATLIMDVSALIRTRVFGAASIDYGLVGRWLGHMLHGQFRHVSIVTAPRVRHERLGGCFITSLAASLPWRFSVSKGLPGYAVRP